eukprot:GHUV01009537.1.p1 GENE.GHUV01009537.1~~GHUV01009537.1.p1  ORF type:complete len:135 (-),score=17.77 GHUV01009537.1:221-625(-)
MVLLPGLHPRVSGMQKLLYLFFFRLLRGDSMYLLLCFFLFRVFFPFASSPQGEQLGRPPAVPPPCGWSTGFIATPRTVGLIPRCLLAPALPSTLFLFCGLLTAPIVARHLRSISRCSPVRTELQCAGSPCQCKL